MNIRPFVALVLYLLVCPFPARGDELCFVPSLAVREENNSNILLATEPANIRRDYITTVSPGFELTDRTERLDSLLLIRPDRLFYGQYKDLDVTNQLYRGSVRYDAKELLKISADAAYQKTFNPSLDIGVTSGPPPGTIIPVPLPPPPGNPGGGNGGGGGGSGSGSDASIPEKQSLPLVALSIERITSSLSADYRLMETTSLTAGYRYSQSYYERPRYHDTTHDVYAGIVIDLGTYLPRVQGRLNTGYSQYIMPHSRTTNVMATIGFSHTISEKWVILIDGGIRRTESEIFLNTQVPFDTQTPPSAYIVVEERQNYTDWGRVGNLSLNYKDMYLGAGLLYTHDFTMVTLAQGYQAPAERNALSLTIQYQMTKELSAALTAGYSTYRHPANIASDAFKQDSVSVSPLIRYDLSQMSGERDLAFEAGYERSRYVYNALDTEADREVFFIRLSARFPYCSSCQYQ